MMKNALLMALLLLIPAAFSCYNNSVEIFASNNLELTYIMLLDNARYNAVSDNSFVYYAQNHSSVMLKVSNDSIIVQSFNNSADWESALDEELYLLWMYNATSLSEEDIIFLSNKGCCGTYESGQFVNSADVCEEEIIIPPMDNSGALAVLMAFFPFIIILLYYSKSDSKKYLAFFAGILGWLAASIAGSFFIIPILLADNLWVYILVPSLLTGLLEEAARFASVKYVGFSRKNFFIFAMGWSFAEVFMNFCLDKIYYIMLNQQVSFIDSMPGLIGSFGAAVLNVALTVIVLKSLGKKKLLLLAVALNSAINVFAVTMMVLNLNVWFVKIALVVLAFWIYYLSNELKGSNNDVKGKDIKKFKRK